MPTSPDAFAAVAAALTGIDPGDTAAVETFYRRQFVEYPLPVRALIADFLIGLSGLPAAAELERLQAAVNGPLADLPAIEAPEWDENYGAAMQYEPPPKSIAVGD